MQHLEVSGAVRLIYKSLGVKGLKTDKRKRHCCVRVSVHPAEFLEVTLEQATKTQRKSRYLYYFFNLDARWGWVVNTTPRPLYPRERPGTDCIVGWLDLRDGLDGCRKFRPPPGFDSRTVQSVASCCTDWTTPTHTIRVANIKYE